MWRKKHGLPVFADSMFLQFLEEQWPEHSHVVHTGRRLDWHLVQECKRALEEFVVHCQDHHPNHLMVFCPQFYYASVDRTWADPLVFQELNSQPEELLAQTFEKIASSIRQRYSWGIDAAGSLPVGFVLLKRKKLFVKGRTIVSYLHSPLRVLLSLLSACSHCVQLMLRTVWEGLDTTLPCMWESLHRYFEEFPSWIHLEERSDDLAGFFNSVPRQMILASLDLLTKPYQDTTAVELFTVDLRKSTASAERALPHKPRGGQSRHMKTVALKHLREVVLLSFQTGCFVANFKCHQQIRGTCRGNQISPALSSIPVILRETVWRRSLESQLEQSAVLLSNLFMRRYMDNRLLVCSQDLACLRSLQEFLHLGFTEPPLSLKKLMTMAFWASHCPQRIGQLRKSSQRRRGKSDTCRAQDPGGFDCQDSTPGLHLFRSTRGHHLIATDKSNSSNTCTLTEDLRFSENLPK